jgi:hypothetical protein
VLPKKPRRSEVSALIKWQPGAVGRHEFDLKWDLPLYPGPIGAGIIDDLTANGRSARGWSGGHIFFLLTKQGGAQ